MPSPKAVPATSDVHYRLLAGPEPVNDIIVTFRGQGIIVDDGVCIRHRGHEKIHEVFQFCMISGSQTPFKRAKNPLDEGGG